MNRAELRRLAQMGAEARLEALQRELTAIYQAFPELRRGSSKSNPYTSGVRAAVSGVRAAVEPAVTRRRRPKMSREVRKRIAEAQRKRWAEWRAKNGRAAPHYGGTTQKTMGSVKKR